MNIPSQQQPTPVQPSYSDRSFLHTQEAAVWVPLRQSGVTGLIVFVVGVVLAFKFNAIDLFTWPLVFGVTSFGAMWLWLQRRWVTLTNLEVWLGKDLDGDHVIGREQAPAPTVIRIENVEAGRYRSRDVKLSADDNQLNQLADGFTYGRPFTEREWTGSGKPFSSTGFRTLRAEMLKGGLIALKVEGEPRQGFVLTEDGQEWRKKYAIPSPTDDGDGV